jgi:hypothetical protein
MGRRRTPQFYYNRQKQNAKRRGVSWELTFEQWWAIWQESGKWNQRGCGRGQYVMSRYNDTGSYAIGNVFIQEAGLNGSQALKKWFAEKNARENLYTKKIMA